MAKRTKQSSGKSKGTTTVVDLSKAEGGRRRFPEGDYKAKLLPGATNGNSKENQTPFVKLRFELVEGKYKGEKVTDYLYLTDASLWRVGALLDAMGVNYPKKKVSLNWAKYVGKELGITLGDNEFNGRITSQITDFIDLDTLAGADVDEEEEDEEDEEDDEDEDEDEEDEDLEDFDTDDEL